MIKKFFEGRYGIDPYSIMLILFSLMLVQTRYLWVFSILLLGYALFRALSKNRQKRTQELMKFNHVLSRYFFFVFSLFRSIKRFFSLQKKRFQERKTSVLTKCPQCSNVLRLPKKKGKLQVSCPVCQNSFVLKT